MALDLILRNARLANAGPEQPTVDIGVHNGRIVAIEPHLTAEGPAYDADGNLATDGTRNYGYYWKGRLSSVAVGGQTVNYGYDGFGRKVARTLGGNTSAIERGPAFC